MRPDRSAWSWVFLLSFSGLVPGLARAQTPAWTTQWGTAQAETLGNVTVDRNGYVYAAGTTKGSLGGTNAGGQDIWAAKYHPDGTKQWLIQFGTEHDEYGGAVAVDRNGKIYIAGTGDDPFSPDPVFNQTGRRVWVSAYDSSGNREWYKELSDQWANGAVYGIAASPSGFIYVAASMSPWARSPTGQIYYAGPSVAVVTKLDSTGTVIWTKTISLGYWSAAHSISADNEGGVFVTGACYAPRDGVTESDNANAWLARINDGGEVVWKRVFGTPWYDFAWAVSFDGISRIYVGGSTEGSLSGTNAGSSDAWLAQYTMDGQRLWMRQLGTAVDDGVGGLAADGWGSVYVSGSTRGSLSGTSAGGWDAWLAKYRIDGSREYLRQYGSAGQESSVAVALSESGSVYLAGETTGVIGEPNSGESDAWLMKFGIPLTETDSRAAAVDGAGNLYVAGGDYGPMTTSTGRSWDAWVAKLARDGTLVWKKRLGSPADENADAVAVDGAGNVVVSGTTHGSLQRANAGGADVWIAKYSGQGALRWIRQFGTAGDERCDGVACDGAGRIYVTGSSRSASNSVETWVAMYEADGRFRWKKGAAPPDRSTVYGGIAGSRSGGCFVSGGTLEALGGAHQGELDVWVSALKKTGDVVWTRQFGTSAYEEARGTSVDTAGNVLLTGYTLGSLDGPSAGGNDAFLAKYDSAGTLAWKRQLGTALNDNGWRVSCAAGGNSFIVGSSDDWTSATERELWLAQYRGDGTLLWKKTILEGDHRFVMGVGADGDSGVYATGFMFMEGNSIWAWVVRYDPKGILLWRRQVQP